MMAYRDRKSNASSGKRLPASVERDVVGLRIIGGRFRGRKLSYSGDLRTRPMKDRLREAVFNLVGPEIRGSHAIDLFAGTGALGLEAISRGAVRATFIEQHFPTAGILRENAAALGVLESVDIVTGNTFIWARRGLPGGDVPWTVFCSPPYQFYVDRMPEMLELIGGLLQAAPDGSAFVVEADERLDFQQLPDKTAWDVRLYAPAAVGVYRKQTARQS
jgi:16S rRNA (guanine966-N2)-methyltransferase